MKRVPTGFVIVVLTLLSLGGCGGQASPAGVDSAFASRVLAICSSVAASQAAWTPFPAGLFDPTKPDPAKLAQVGAWLESDIAPTFVAWRDDTAALGDPMSGQDAWDPIVAGLGSNVTLVAEQIAAAKAGDPAAFASATKTLKANHLAFVAATKAAGVAACGDIVSD